MKREFQKEENMLNKLFCNHHYEYFHTDEFLGIFTAHWHTQWHYVCKKCGKTNVIQKPALDDFLKKTSMKVKKEEVFGTDNSKYNDLVFYIGNYILKGKTAYYTEKRLKRFHQEKTIS